MKQPTQRDIQAQTRKRQLLDIALTLFAERGIENVTIKDLAAEADVAQGLIYYYFHSKDELLSAVFQRYNPLSEFEAIIQQLSDMPARDGLLLFTHHLSQLLPERRLVIRLLIREMLSPRSNLLPHVLAFREEVIGRLAEYFQQRIDAGELKPHQPMISIHMVVSSFLILLLLEQPLESYVPQIVATMLDGIAT